MKVMEVGSKVTYKYLTFELIEMKTKTLVYSCYNSNLGTELGKVKWYPQWRQYCYFPTVQVVYNKDCLKHIVQFIEKLKWDRA